jgi:aspartyl-tRNA(Asn)/glutamyl-tRNA(Gln) amidotransferase subunit C
MLNDNSTEVFLNNSKKHSDMSVDKSTVAKIARLARIHVPEERQESIAEELNGILSWVDELNEVNTDNVEPLANVTGHGLPMREDVVTDGNRIDEVLANVPETAGGFFVVPKVVE